MLVTDRRKLMPMVVLMSRMIMVLYCNAQGCSMMMMMMMMMIMLWQNSFR